MLNENIKIYRKAKGFSQETLAQELNIVRQTVSKWEKGLSVPDADMLIKLSEVLEVPVTALLGSAEEPPINNPDNSQIASQLYILNNQLANELYRRKKMRKILLVILALVIALIGFSFVSFNIYSVKTQTPGDISQVTILYGKSKRFSHEDIDIAVDIVKQHFANEFKGCRLLELSYVGDKRSALEYNYMAGTNKIDETLVLTSSFYVDKNGGSSGFNTDFQYDNWNWIFGRIYGGEWILLGNGMG